LTSSTRSYTDALDNSLSDEIKHAVRSLETIQTRDLTALLARVPNPG
jgi:hypothetical protein